MNRTASVLTASALTLGLAFGASAQTRPATEPSTRDTATTKAQRQAWAPSATAVEASKLIGTKVKNEAGKDLGEIDQLLVDSGDGKVTHVVIGKGGVLGVGEQKVVLSWSDVKLQSDPNNRNRMVAMVDQSKVDAAPRYEARRDRDTAPAASPGTTPSSQPRPDKKP
jgi:sporulation protein YlmC with PRC-barrel domain